MRSSCDQCYVLLPSHQYRERLDPCRQKCKPDISTTPQHDFLANSARYVWLIYYIYCVPRSIADLRLSLRVASICLTLQFYAHLVEAYRGDWELRTLCPGYRTQSLPMKRYDVGSRTASTVHAWSIPRRISISYQILFPRATRRRQLLEPPECKSWPTQNEAYFSMYSSAGAVFAARRESSSADFIHCQSPIA